MRLNIVVEGHTERAFGPSVLLPHLAGFGLDVRPRLVRTSAGSGKPHVGGVVTYGQVRRDITRWLREVRSSEARFTTMFDLHRLPHDFPRRDDPGTSRDAYERARALEQAMARDIGDWRFVPYLQLHEFEALPLSDPGRFAERFPGEAQSVEALVALAAGYESPELIDEGPSTSPSARIRGLLPTYDKVTDGVAIAQSIGLPTLRDRCPHFDQWLCALEALALPPPPAV